MASIAAVPASRPDRRARRSCSSKPAAAVPHGNSAPSCIHRASVSAGAAGQEEAHALAESPVRIASAQARWTAIGQSLTSALNGRSRSEERRVRNEWVSTCSSRGAPYSYKKKKKKKQ